MMQNTNLVSRINGVMKGKFGRRLLVPALALGIGLGAFAATNPQPVPKQPAALQQVVKKDPRSEFFGNKTSYQTIDTTVASVNRADLRGVWHPPNISIGARAGFSELYGPFADAYSSVGGLWGLEHLYGEMNFTVNGEEILDMLLSGASGGLIGLPSVLTLSPLGKAFGPGVGLGLSSYWNKEWGPHGFVASAGLKALFTESKWGSNVVFVGHAGVGVRWPLAEWEVGVETIMGGVTPNYFSPQHLYFYFQAGMGLPFF